MSGIPPGDPSFLLGRDDDVERLTRLLHGGVRLITLRGPGGIGKTALAWHLAHTLIGIPGNRPPGWGHGPPVSPYSRRMTMGQLTMTPLEPNFLPPGPVMKPFCTIERYWNSSIRRER